MNKDSKHIIIILILLSFYNSVVGQDVWESFGTSISPWKVSPNLQCNQNTVNKVDFINLNYPSDEDIIKHVWDPETVSINTGMYMDVPLEISFTVKNISTPLKSVYCKTKKGETKLYSNQSRYWLVEINYLSQSNQNKYYTLLYSLSKYSDSNTTYESASTNDNGLNTGWHRVNGKSFRQFKIVFYDGAIQIYDNNGDDLVKTIYDVKALSSVAVGAGPGTELEITNTSCQKMTIYGQSLPYMEKAADYMDNNNYSAAESEMTKAINQGLKCYYTYLMRGFAYFLHEYYKSAIEDFTSALNYSANNKEQAYYYRGLSKLALDDDDGINDMKKGGQEGLVFLRENNLMDYTPGQSKQKTTNQRNTSSSSQPKKPALKK